MLRLIYLTIFISLCMTVSAQKYNSDYGAKIGLNYSSVLGINDQLNYEVTNQYKSRVGISAGAFYMHDFTRFLGADIALETNLLGIDATSPTTRLNYFYASLPVALRLNIDDFFISGGALPSYLVRGSAKDITGTLPSQESDMFFEPIENLDIQWQAGIGWRNTDAFILALSFQRSISSISKIYNLQHQYVQLSLRYFLKENIKKMLAE